MTRKETQRKTAAFFQSRPSPPPPTPGRSRSYYCIPVIYVRYRSATEASRNSCSRQIQKLFRSIHTRAPHQLPLFPTNGRHRNVKTKIIITPPPDFYWLSNKRRVCVFFIFPIFFRFRLQAPIQFTKNRPTRENVNSSTPPHTPLANSTRRFSDAAAAVSPEETIN